MLCKSDLEDDIASYIKDRIPKADIQCVFDVGSNVGWFSHEFGKTYRNATFYLFEPSPPIFAGIHETLARFPDLKLLERTNLFPVALGYYDGIARITKIPDVTINKIVEDATDSAIDVKMTTGDAICAELGISHIDYLKVDTEGYDMNVLIGFTKILAAGKVDFVQVEAGIGPDSKDFVNLDVFTGFLSLFNYKLFRFINQASVWNRPLLNRADVVFIHHDAATRFGKDE